MKDFNGVEVNVGDSVICMVKNYRSLVKAQVVKITEKTVVVQYINPLYTDWEQSYRLMSDQFIVVNKGE